MQKPKFSYSIANLLGGTTMPETLLAKLCAENQSAVGFMVREKDKFVVEKHNDVGKLTPTAYFEFMKQVNEKTSAFNRTVIFHAFPPAFDEEEVQPYTMLRDSKKNPLLCVAVEGDILNLPEIANPEGFSDVWLFVNNVLGPKIEKMYKFCGNDPSRLMAYLKDEDFKKEMASYFGHRGIISFMPSSGDPFNVGDVKDTGVDASWGKCSFCYGYTEPVIEAATVEKAPEPTRKKSAYADDSPAPAPEKPAAPPTPVVVPPAAAPASDPVTKTVEALAKKKKVPWTPSRDLQGKALKDAYRAKTKDEENENGYLPNGWENYVTIMIEIEDIPKEPVAPIKDFKTAATALATKDQPVAPDYPTISGKDQQHAVDFIKKNLSADSQLITDPLAEQKKEAILATFSQLCLKSKNLDEVNRWLAKKVFEFGHVVGVNVLVLAILEYRRERYQMQQEIKQLRSLLKVDANTTMKELVNTAPEQVEVPPAGDGPAQAPVQPAEPAAPPAPEPKPEVAPRRKSAYA